VDEGGVMNNITIVGAGLSGTLCALYLARRGYKVDLFESRPDVRNSSIDYGRSINLALSCRGITGLGAMDLMDEVQHIIVPMRARAIHEANGEVHYQPFGRDEDEYINAISRTELNSLLLTKAEKSPFIHLHFDMKLLHLNIHNKKLHFETKDKSHFEFAYHRLIGADGASSQIRETLKNEGVIEDSRDFYRMDIKNYQLVKPIQREWPVNTYIFGLVILFCY